MSIAGIVAIYFIVWWVTLFAVLPWGVRSQVESARLDGQEVIPGTDPGAPVRPLLWRKVAATSVIAVLITAGIVYLTQSGWVSLEDLPMPFDTTRD